jgi:hypothetical protein
LTPEKFGGKADGWLAFLIDEHPNELTIPEVSWALNPCGSDSGGDEVERAIRELVGARLLHCRDGLVMPTRAALYSRKPRSKRPGG